MLSIHKPIYRHTPNHAILKNKVKSWSIIFETHAEFLLAGMKARWDEGGGRILLGGNIGAGEDMLRLITIQGRLGFQLLVDATGWPIHLARIFYRSCTAVLQTLGRSCEWSGSCRVGQCVCVTRVLCSSQQAAGCSSSVAYTYNCACVLCVSGNSHLYHHK